MKKINEKIKYIPFGIIIFMCLGSIYSWSIFKKPLEELLNLNATESGLPYMFFLVCYALTMPMAGVFIDKYGPKVITLVGGVIVSLAWIFSSFATSIEVLTVTYGIIGGIGVGIVYGAPMAVAAKWFPERKGLAVGLTLSGFGLSPFVTAPLSRYLISQHGVFLTFRVLGIAFLVIITILSMQLKFPKKEIQIKDENKKIAMDELSLKEVLKNKNFYFLWFCFVIGTFTGLMAIGITSPVAQEIIKIDAGLAAGLIQLFAVFNGIGRPIFGIATDKLGARKASIISFTLIIFASILMISSKEGNIIKYVIAFSIFWFILGGWLSIAPTAVSNIFGAKNYARNYGVLFTAYGLGALLGTLSSGEIRDYFGTYTYAFYPTIGMATLGIVISGFLLKDKKVSK